MLGNFVRGSNYQNRFAFDNRMPRSRYKSTCPVCGRQKCFTEIMDMVTGEIMPGFGICDHTSKCGFKNFPKGKDFEDTRMFVPESHIKPELVDHGVSNSLEARDILPYLKNYDKNTLFIFLCTLFDESLVYKVFSKYNVGTIDIFSWNGCSVFFQTDVNYITRTGKILDYDKRTGKRVKDGYGNGHITYMHSMIYPDYSLKQCLFGEHLLNEFGPDEVVNIVESEKTAIICSLNSPNKLFMATGGLMNLRLSVMEVLYGKKIIAHPDKGSGYSKWGEKTSGFLSDFNIELSDFLENKKNFNDGDDIADCIISKRSKKNNQ